MARSVELGPQDYGAKIFWPNKGILVRMRLGGNIEFGNYDNGKHRPSMLKSDTMPRAETSAFTVELE